jgi:hypothetical protein
LSDTGNTIGRLVGQPPLSAAPAWAANPPIVAETPEEAAWLARLHAAQMLPGDIPEVGAVMDETGALVYAIEATAARHLTGQDATPGTAQQAKPWRGVDGARVLGKGDPAICMECLVHAASSGAITLERL